MTRGTTLKTETDAYTELLRPMITRRYSLTISHELCCGCGMCEIVCPREAISLSEPLVEDGHTVVMPRVDLDKDACSFCGECAAICPTHAMKLFVNGESENPVVKAGVWPLFSKRVSVNQDVLSAVPSADYVDACPAGAISATVERDQNGDVVSVQDVQVDRSLCFSCTRCMVDGPDGGFDIGKPYQGWILLNDSLCPEGCEACADVCPTHALHVVDNRVVLDDRVCLYCKACERVCPVDGALEVQRTGYLHMPVESGAWRVALEKLVDIKAVRREFAQKTQGKRRQAVAQRLLGEMKD